MFSVPLAYLYVQCIDDIWPVSFYDVDNVIEISIQGPVEPVENWESVGESPYILDESFYFSFEYFSC